MSKTKTLSPFSYHVECQNVIFFMLINLKSLLLKNRIFLSYMRYVISRRRCFCCLGCQPYVLTRNRNREYNWPKWKFSSVCTSFWLYISNRWVKLNPSSIFIINCVIITLIPRFRKTFRKKMCWGIRLSNVSDTSITCVGSSALVAYPTEINDIEIWDRKMS